MSRSRVTEGELIAALGGIGLFLFLFLDWLFDASAWEAFDIIDVILAVIALTPPILVGIAMAGERVTLPVDIGTLCFALGAIATTIVLTFILEGDDLKIGIFLSLFASIAITYGGWRIRGRTVAGPPPGAPAEPVPPRY
jgi:hypothetical protein